MTPDPPAAAYRFDAPERPALRTIVLRAAAVEEASTIHGLIEANLESGHLLPRTLEEVRRHASRFVVAVDEAQVVGCAELAPLSRTVAEVRSLVVADNRRGAKLGTRLLEALTQRARREGFGTLCAFTHEPAPFVHLGFSFVPHVWVPEKIATDCRGCALFRRCGQYAVVYPLARPARSRRIDRAVTDAAPPRVATGEVPA